MINSSQYMKIIQYLSICPPVPTPMQYTILVPYLSLDYYTDCMRTLVFCSSGLRGGADWAKARGPYHLGAPIPKYVALCPT